MLRWLLAAACLLAIATAGGGAALAATATAPDPPAPPDTVATSENVFLPEDEELSECVSALPPPDCGSESRGGWRQALVFVAVGIGLALVVWRIVRATRRRTP